MHTAGDTSPALDERVRAAAAKAFQLTPNESSDLTPAHGFGRVRGWDSAGHLALVLELEEAFHVQFNDAVIPKLVNLGAIASALRDMGA